ncbi:MAG: hypothetical protein H7Y37_10900 [Anaerolineae bacterium]|nr:hypothetical protein [Gloeobacterales cyanobacterium ES-bin-313]
MYTIDVILRGNPLSFSVQRKEAAGATALYQQIVAALSSDHSKLLELTCEKMTEKRIAVMSGDITAVQVNTPKSGSSSVMGMRSPGFFSGVEKDDED